MSENKEQTTAALNTMIDLALQVARQQQNQVQAAANILATTLDLGREEPQIVHLKPGEALGQVEEDSEEGICRLIAPLKPPACKLE